METPRQIVARAALAAIGHVDCSPQNAGGASRIICNFVMGELKAAGYAFVPEEPTNQQVIAALEWALSWMTENGVDGLSPFSDYPPVGQTTKVMYRAMIGAAVAPPSTDTDMQGEER